MLFGFSEIGGAAVVVPTVLGVAVILLTISPFLFGFIDEAPNAWQPHVVVGITVILAVLFSEKQPGPAVTPVVK